MADPWIRALLDERAGYVARGLTERIEAVDAELSRRGAEPPGRPVEEATQTPPEQPGGSRPGGTRRGGSGRPRGGRG